MTAALAAYIVPFLFSLLADTHGKPCNPAHYSIFDSALYRILEAKWLFPHRGPQRQVFVVGVEVKATFHDLQTSTSESKML